MTDCLTCKASEAIIKCDFCNQLKYCSEICKITDTTHQSECKYNKSNLLSIINQIQSLTQQDQSSEIESKDEEFNDELSQNEIDHYGLNSLKLQLQTTEEQLHRYKSLYHKILDQNFQFKKQLESQQVEISNKHDLQKQLIMKNEEIQNLKLQSKEIQIFKGDPNIIKKLSLNELQNYSSQLLKALTQIQQIQQSKLQEEQQKYQQLQTQLSDIYKCIICVNRDVEILAKPCNHACMCEFCVFKVDSCPMCRKAISSTEKIFLLRSQLVNFLLNNQVLTYVRKFKNFPPYQFQKIKNQIKLLLFKPASYFQKEEEICQFLIYLNN